MSDNRPSRYIETDADGNETVVYRASSLGGCDRAMVAYARGHVPRPHPKWFQEVLDEGTNAEDAIDAMWVRETGVGTTKKQAEYELFVGIIEGRRVIIRCHPDGIDDHGVYVREYKKFRPSTFPQFREKGAFINEYYPWQVSIEMLVTGMTCQFVGGEFVDGEIVSVLPFIYGVPPISLVKIKQTIARVERLINEGYGAEEVPCTKRFPCPFWPLHDDVLAGGETRVVLDTPGAVAAVKNLEFYAGEIAAAKAGLANLEAKKKRQYEVIAKEMDRLGIGSEKKLTINGQSVTRVQFETPATERTVQYKASKTDYFKLTNRKGATGDHEAE